MFRRRRVKDSLTGVYPELILMLREALASEIQAFWLYQRASGFLKGEGALRLDEFLRATAFDELFDHGTKLQKRLSELDGCLPPALCEIDETSPATKFSASICTIETSLSGIISEWEACDMYKKFIASCESLNDPTTKRLFEDILKDEEEHLKSFTDIADQVLLRAFKNTRGPMWIPVGTTHQVLVVLTEAEARVVAWMDSSKGTFIHYETPQEGTADLVDHLISEMAQPAVIPAEDFSEMTNAAISGSVTTSCDDVCCNSSCDACCVTGPNGSELLFNPSPESIMDSVVRVTNQKARAKGVKFVMDSMQEREVDGKKIRVQEFQSAEEANKFLEANKGYIPVDRDDQGKVYVALQSQV